MNPNHIEGRKWNTKRAEACGLLPYEALGVVKNSWVVLKRIGEPPIVEHINDFGKGRKYELAN